MSCASGSPLDRCVKRAAAHSARSAHHNHPTPLSVPFSSPTALPLAEGLGPGQVSTGRARSSSVVSMLMERHPTRSSRERGGLKSEAPQGSIGHRRAATGYSWSSHFRDVGGLGFSTTAAWWPVAEAGLWSKHGGPLMTDRKPHGENLLSAESVDFNRRFGFVVLTTDGRALEVIDHPRSTQSSCYRVWRAPIPLRKRFFQVVVERWHRFVSNKWMLRKVLRQPSPYLEPGEHHDWLGVDTKTQTTTTLASVLCPAEHTTTVAGFRRQEPRCYPAVHISFLHWAASLSFRTRKNEASVANI